MTPAVELLAEVVVHRDPASYCAHPHLVRCRGELLCLFTCGPRRPFVLHPPEDPAFTNLLARSADEGASWSAPVPVPGPDWTGVECGSLTALPDGGLLLHQHRFDWLDLAAAEARPERAAIAWPEDLVRAHLASAEHEPEGLGLERARALLPWARAPGRAFLHRSADGGRSWPTTVPLDTAPYEGGYGLRGGVVLADGTVLLPLADCPAYRRVFALHSADGGWSWSPPVPVAEAPDRRFEEPAPLLLTDGRVLLLLRENASRTLWRVESADGGRSWSKPEPTAIDGYPAHLCRLPDGRILCTYGFRRPPFAIRAVLSQDDGRSWRTGTPLEVAGGLGSKDLGYPCTLPREDGTLLTVFYARDREGVTFPRARIWRLR